MSTITSTITSTSKSTSNNNNDDDDDEELKPLDKCILADLQRLAKLYKIDTKKMGNCDKKVNKLKAELYEEIKIKQAKK